MQIMDFWNLDWYGYLGQVTWSAICKTTHHWVIAP